MWRSGDARVACPSSNAERGATGRPTDLLELDWTDRPNGDCRMRRRRRHPQHFCSNSNSADFLPSLPPSFLPAAFPLFLLAVHVPSFVPSSPLVVCSSVRSYRRRDAAAASFGASPLPVPALPHCLQRILIRTSYFTGRIVSAATAAVAVCSAYCDLTVRRETGANVVVFPR